MVTHVPTLRGITRVRSILTRIRRRLLRVVVRVTRVVQGHLRGRLTKLNRVATAATAIGRVHRGRIVIRMRRRVGVRGAVRSSTGVITVPAPAIGASVILIGHSNFRNTIHPFSPTRLLSSDNGRVYFIDR